MKSRIWVFTLCMLLVLSWAVAVPAADQKFKLRMGHYLAKGPFVAPEENFAKKIEERTNGRVTIDIAWANALGKAEEVLTLAGRGAIDMGVAAPGYYANQLLFWKAFQMPYQFTTPGEAIRVLLKCYEAVPGYKEDMDKMGLIWLYQQPLGLYYITGKYTDGDKIENLKGKKIRSFGEYFPKSHMAIGAVPVNLFTTEIFEALQRGVIDYSWLNAGNIHQYKLWEVGKYNYGPITCFSGHNITIGKPTWNKLPKDIQDIFLDQAKKSQEEYIDFVDNYEAESVKKIVAAGGVFKEFQPGELDKWKKACPDYLAMWVKDCEGRGAGDQARKVAQIWKDMIGKK